MTKRAEEALRLLAQERQLRDGIALDDLEAWALYHAGRFDDARVASDRARRLGTRDAALLYHAGAIRLAQGEDDGGRALLREALALNPAFDVHGAAHARALLASPATATTSRVASAGSAP